ELEFGKLHYPVFHPPEHFTREGYLRHLLAEGLRRRYGIHARAEGDEFIIAAIDDARRLPTFQPAEGQTCDSQSAFSNLADPAIAAAVKVVIDRLQLELKVIEKTGFISYFLIVADFVQFGRNIGVACVARGSAAGSIVTYLLEIANIDPIR